MRRQLRKNYSYTPHQLQRDFNVHPRTLQTWGKDGLPFVNNSRPRMVFSEDLREFLAIRELKRRTKLQLNEFYCMSCKTGCEPYQGKVHVEASQNLLRLRAICPHCGIMMNKNQNRKKYESVTPLFEAATLADLHICQRANYSEKTHLERIDTSTPNEPCDDSHLLHQENLL